MTASRQRASTSYAGVVEIRIHGVSGTPPSELLDRQIVNPVAGDQTAGFYRPSVDSQRRDRIPGTDPTRGPWLEAFSWSGLTSGSATRALWILLLPFGLVNVAPYAVPGPPKRGEDIRWENWRRRTSALNRLLAGTLTASIAIGAAGVGMVTFTARCYSEGQHDRRCFGVPLWVTDRLGDITPVWRWAAGAIVPLAVVIGVLMISRRSDRAESLPVPLSVPTDAEPQLRRTPAAEPPATRSAEAVGRGSESPLAKADLFTSGLRARHQRGIHAQVALAVIGLIAGWPLAISNAASLAVLIGLFVVVIVCDTALLWQGHDAFKGSRMPIRQVIGWVAVCTLGLFDLACCFFSTNIPPAGQLMRWFDTAVRFGFWVQSAIVLAIFLTVYQLRRRTEKRHLRRLFFFGWTTAFFAAGAWLLGAAATTAAMIVVPAWLATPGLTMGPSALGLTMTNNPDWFPESAAASGLGILAIVVLGVVVALACTCWTATAVWLPWAAGRQKDRDAVIAMYGNDDRLKPQTPGGRQESTSRLHRIGRRLLHIALPWRDCQPDIRRRAMDVARIFWWARRVDYIPWLMCSMAMVSAVLLAAVGIIDMACMKEVDGQLRPCLSLASAGDRVVDAIRPDGWAAPIAWGVWLAAFGLIAGLCLSLLATRDSSLRRHIGIIWDVASFWPRDTHPLAPPCYNERAIPQLEHRIRYYVGDLDESIKGSPAGTDRSDHEDDDISRARRVILAGHSQGSVIAFAAIVRLSGTASSRVALLTYGSVLARLYSRFFPYYFGPDQLAIVAQKLTDGSGSTRWRNLYRNSDFLGGPIDRKKDDPCVLQKLDVQCEDPLFRSQPGDNIYPAAGRHSRFERDPSFQTQIRELVTTFGDKYWRFRPQLPYVSSIPTRQPQDPRPEPDRPALFR